MRYRLQTSSFAWIVHRVTGIVLAFYLCVHLLVLSSLRDPQRFESLMTLMKDPFVRLAEVSLLFLVIAHALNGIRVMLHEAGLPTRFRNVVFYVVCVIGVAVFILGSIPIMGGAH